MDCIPIPTLSEKMVIEMTAKTSEISSPIPIFSRYLCEISHSRANVNKKQIFICVFLHAIEMLFCKYNKYVQITRWKLNEYDCKITMLIVCAFSGDHNRISIKIAIAFRRIIFGSSRRAVCAHVAKQMGDTNKTPSPLHVNHYLFIYLYYG